MHAGRDAFRKLIKEVEKRAVIPDEDDRGEQLLETPEAVHVLMAKAGCSVTVEHLKQIINASDESEQDGTFVDPHMYLQWTAPEPVEQLPDKRPVVSKVVRGMSLVTTRNDSYYPQIQHSR